MEKRENKYKKALIEFTQLGAFKYHFKEIIGKDQVILKKPSKDKIQVICSNERAITVSTM